MGFKYSLVALLLDCRRTKASGYSLVWYLSHRGRKQLIHAFENRILAKMKLIDSTLASTRFANCTLPINVNQVEL